MKLCILVAYIVHWTLTLGEFWTATVRDGVRCTDVFHNSITTTQLKCFRDCLSTSKCCSVNYVKKQNLCEFCTAGPMVRLITAVSYRYIGYTVKQKEPDNADHINENPCYACAEYLDHMEISVITTVDGKVKTLKCNYKPELETGITEERCEYRMNRWSSKELTCQETCYDRKEDFNKSFTTLTNGGKCLSWDDNNSITKSYPDSFFKADGNSKASAKNFCRHPTLTKLDKYYESVAYLWCNHDDPNIRRAMCAVRKCDSTDLKQCGAPPPLPSPAVRSYPVVGDVFLANYKCSKYSGDNPTPHCPVSRCIGNNNWTKPSMSCSKQDCVVAGKHGSYVGKRTCTESGRTCQSWTSNVPHLHGNSRMRTESNSNFCRGIKNRKPWCFTTDPNVRYETCGIPEC